MRLSLFCFILFSLSYVTSTAQVSDLLQDGFVSLEIRLKGALSEKSDFAHVRGGNIFSYDKALNLMPVNDSTYLLSFYSFGATPIYFMYGDIYI